MATASHEVFASRAQLRSIPWYIWCAVIGVTSAMIGGHWDVSWHSSIGRDTFWTPAHMAIYLCGVLAGLAFGYIILFTTLSKSAPLAASSVHIWGFRAPLGAFIAAWGGIAMLTSAPFDNWWHNAYGLDVKIVSPPHMLLFAGLYGVLVGTLALIAGHRNRASGPAQRIYGWLFLWVAGVILVLAMFVIMEYTERTALHRALPYILISAIAPITFVIASRATAMRFAATFVAGFYTTVLIGLILVLPLFPAEPKLGPVYQHVTQFIPPEFPMLLLVPAFALDLLWQRVRMRNKWLLAALSAALFVGLLAAVEWPFASFLMTPAARNRFFGSMYFWYGLPPSSYMAQNRFYQPDGPAGFLEGLAIALLLSTIVMRWAFSRGEWFRSVKR